MLEKAAIKVLLVYSLDDVPSCETPVRLPGLIQFGISYIAAMLERSGHELRLLVLGSNISEKKNHKLTKMMLAEFDPRIVCFTAVASQYPFVKGIADFIRNERKDLFLLVGGPHASLNPENVIKDAFDGLCIGEGEFATLELVEMLDRGKTPSGIANLWIKGRDGNIEKNPTRALIEDLDCLPFPSRIIWSRWIRRPDYHQVAILVGRGCPFDCSYCSNHALRRLAAGRYVRMRSPGSVISELEELRAAYPHVSDVYMESESIALNKTWLLDFCKKVEVFNRSTGDALTFGANFRVTKQSVDEEIFEALKTAGFRYLSIGLESGSERVRKEILNRDYSNDDFLRAVSMARRHGMKISVYNMIGMPGETYADYFETVKINRMCQPEKHATSIFFPYPGTAIHELCLRQGLLNNELDGRLERRRAALDVPGFSRKQIQSAFRWFEYRVYRGYRSRFRLLYRIVAGRVWESAATASFLRMLARAMRSITSEPSKV